MTIRFKGEYHSSKTYEFTVGSHKFVNVYQDPIVMWDYDEAIPF